MISEWLPEQIKTIKNICLITDILINLEKEELLPTVLEIMLEHVQQVVDENCVVAVDKKVN